MPSVYMITSHLSTNASAIPDLLEMDISANMQASYNVTRKIKHFRFWVPPFGKKLSHFVLKMYHIVHTRLCIKILKSKLTRVLNFKD